MTWIKGGDGQKRAVAGSGRGGMPPAWMTEPANRLQPGNSATKTAPEGAVFHVRHLTDGEQAAGLFVFQVGVALQTQLQLVEQGLAGLVVQRRVGDDALVVLADHGRVDVDVT